MTIGNNTILKGKVHGRTIDLDSEPGLPDGQEVRVRIEPVNKPFDPVAFAAAVRRTAGAWADDAEELDKFMQWNREQRKHSRGPIDPS